MTDESPDVIVVDDDPMVGTLTRDLLLDEGYKVLLIQDSLSAISALKEKKPRLLIMDIMMPGLDGMEICKRVKSDPDLKNVKVILVSGKSMQIEKQRAFKLGADSFIQKPYNVDIFAQTIRQVLEGTTARSAPPSVPPPVAAPVEVQPAPEPPDLEPGTIRVGIWGCRGLSPVIPNSASKYGRQTSCVSVETRDHLFVLDAGTGIIPLGEEIIRKRRPREIWNVITHFHLDHIIGLSSFAPAHRPEYSIHIAGANDPEKKLRDAVQQAFYGSFAWLQQQPSAKIDLYEVIEDTYELVPGVKLSTMYANHPTTTLCLGLELFGKKIIYSPDSEIFSDTTAMQDYDEKLGNFCKGADILIHDANYTDEQYDSHKNQGHSGATNTLEFAAEKAAAKELVLFHLNASATDEELDAMHETCVKTAAANGWPIKCGIAKEGDVFLLK